MEEGTLNEEVGVPYGLGVRGLSEARQSILSDLGGYIAMAQLPRKLQ